MDFTTSKSLVLTDTANGHQFLGSTFSSSSSGIMKYLQIAGISAGTLSIKFGSSDDWVVVTTGFTVSSLAFDEFWLKATVTSNVDVIVSQI